MERRGGDSLCGALYGDAGDGHHGGDLVEEEDFAKKIRCGMENRKIRSTSRCCQSYQLFPWYLCIRMVVFGNSAQPDIG